MNNKISEITDNIYKKFEKNQNLIYSESDLKCQMYSELAKDKSYSILTEWTIDKKNKRKRPDIVLYDEKKLDITKEYFDIKEYKSIIELKVFYYQSKKSKKGSITTNTKYLSYFKELTNNLFLICFDLTENKIPPKELDELIKKAKEKKVVLIYKYLNNQPSQRYKENKTQNSK